jgi:gp48
LIKDLIMISAKEAYDIATPKLDEYREFLDKKIREAANKGETSVIVRESPYDMWLYIETELDDRDAKRCIKELRDLGYTVSHFYKEGSQFVDVGLFIDWGKNK